jgi:hypothetical protein
MTVSRVGTNAFRCRESDKGLGRGRSSQQSRYPRHLPFAFSPISNSRRIASDLETLSTVAPLIFSPNRVAHFRINSGGRLNTDAVHRASAIWSALSAGSRLPSTRMAPQVWEQCPVCYQFRITPRRKGMTLASALPSRAAEMTPTTRSAARFPG